MNLKPYPKYRDTREDWLPIVPESWEALRCKYVYREVNERSEDGAEDLLSVSEYYGVKQRKEVIDEGEFISRAESLEGYKKCRRDDLVMNIMLAWKCGLGVTDFDGIVSPAYSVFRLLKSTQYHRDYLRYLLRTPLYTTEYKRHSTGVIDSRLRLYPESFGCISVLTPPFEEQQAIATFLDNETARIDRLIEKQQQLIALLKEKRQAVISHAVTKGLDPNVPMKDSGVEWLGEVPAHWVVTPLKHISLLQSGIAKGREVPSEEAIRVPYIRVANVQDGFLNLNDVAEISIKRTELSRYLLKNGDVLMNEGGDFDKLGRGAIWNGEVAPCIHQNHVFAIRPTTVESEWVTMATQAGYAKHYFILVSKQSTNLASISSSNLKETPIVLPPADERRAILMHITRVTERLDALKLKSERMVELLQEHRTALVSTAVTGKIDVRNHPSAQPANKEVA